VSHDKNPKPQSTVSPEVPSEVSTGTLYKGKVHFRMPSVEDSFDFPESDPLDSESLAAEAVRNGANGASSRT
jgi:hypothetical protein